MGLQDRGAFRGIPLGEVTVSMTINSPAAVLWAMYLAVAPEGTRKGSPQWKTGFYFIASQAGVPILPVTFDFRERVVYLLDPFHPTGDLAADLPRIQALFAGRTGCRATRSSGA